MKFTPKHRARDVAKILEVDHFSVSATNSLIFKCQRAVAIAAQKYEAIPEQLHVKEICVTKGNSHRKVRPMGRGRTGFGTMRWSHVNLKVEVIDFDDKITKASTLAEKSLWSKRKTLVESLKANPPTYVVQGKKPSGRKNRVPEEEATEAEANK